LIGVITDITDQKRAENRLAESKRKFESIFDNSQIGIMLLRGGRVLVRCNQRLASILGYEKLARRAWWVKGLISGSRRASACERKRHGMWHRRPPILPGCGC